MKKIKFWCKKIKNNKIIEEKVLQGDYDLFEIAKECANIFNLSTPVILKKHENEIREFNITRFYKEDFIDDIDFKALEIEMYE